MVPSNDSYSIPQPVVIQQAVTHLPSYLTQKQTLLQLPSNSRTTITYSNKGYCIGWKGSRFKVAMRMSLYHSWQVLSSVQAVIKEEFENQRSINKIPSKRSLLQRHWNEPIIDSWVLLKTLEILYRQGGLREQYQSSCLSRAALEYTQKHKRLHQSRPMDTRTALTAFLFFDKTQ